MLTVGQVPHDYVQVSSGLGEAPPRNIVVLPVLFEGEVKAVLELATFDEFDEIHLTFLEQLTESIGIVLNTIAANMRTEELLKQSQALTESLQSQQEELKETNERLEQQTRSLQQSEELLKKQQEELQQTNAELEEKAQLLARQKAEVEQKNSEVEQAKVALEEKAEQLALISKYKSEFLANMSHELRTPLNSMLILSQILSENTDDNLTTKQVGFAQTIHTSGSDLLDLINDILDLSKIESGTMAVDISDGAVRRGAASSSRAPSARWPTSRACTSTSRSIPRLPPAIQTDTKRLQQVLKNLLSNAFKFTERGSVVAARPRSPPSGWNPEQEMLNARQRGRRLLRSATPASASPRRSTASSSRRSSRATPAPAASTAAPASASRSAARSPGCSAARSGSRARRARAAPSRSTCRSSTRSQPAAPPSIGEDRRRARPRAGAGQGDADGQLARRCWRRSSSARSATTGAPIEDGDRILLIAEDDPTSRRSCSIWRGTAGFKGLVAQRADRALALAREYQPTAVTLDLRLPDADGWTILDRLKHDPATRHIPVHIISVEENWQRGLRLGAIDFLTKPATKESLSEALTTLHEFVDRPVKRLLVVEDDEPRSRASPS